MKENENFSEWFDGQFLCSRDSASPLLLSENKTMKGKYLRIKRVCLFLLMNPKMSDEDVRKEIAMNFFVSMRCALDYLNYAKLVLDKYKRKI
jgi:hypothetical protein